MKLCVLDIAKLGIKSEKIKFFFNKEFKNLQSLINNIYKILIINLLAIKMNIIV
jgi:hypothetical protein